MKFEYNDMRFTPGTLSEKIALDRYSVSSVNPKDFAVGDTIVFIDDEAKGTRKVGEITGFYFHAVERANVKDRDGNVHGVALEHITKPLETTPQAYWARWAHGAALVEGTYSLEYVDERRKHFENEFAWLFDGFRYSPGGRIQLGLGHEYLGLPKANLTLVNCFVGPRIAGSSDPIEQWRFVLDNLRNQIEIQRRGGGKTRSWR